MLVRSLLFNLAFYLNFVVLGLALSPFLLLPERYGWWVVKFWAGASLFWHRLICGVGEEIRGAGNIPAGGLLVAVKHQSTWETLRLVTLLHRPTFILKRELTWIPLFGWYLLKFGQIPIDRSRKGGAIEAMNRRARRAVDEGRQIIIFPEGTRRAPGAPPAYKQGVARLYERLGAPCLPIAHNAGLFWPRRQIEHAPGTVIVSVLPAIPPGLPAPMLLAAVEAAIERETSALIAEALSRHPELRRRRQSAPEHIAADPDRL